MTIFKTALVLVLASVTLSTAAGQTIYRCGNSYSQSACADAQVIDAADPRSEAQLTEARRVAAEDRRLAAQMQRDRLADEAARAPKVVAAKGRAARPAGAREGNEHGSSKKDKRGRARPPDMTDPIIVAPAPPKRRAHV
jgi:hypothetical protein